MTIPRKSSSTPILPVNQLSRLLASTPLLSFARQSRIHSLRSIERCFVKREDELGFGISGTKLRKYLSLLPQILKEKPDEAIVMGSSYSNHVLSISQLLRENGIEPILFLIGDPQSKLQGNLLYSVLFAEPKNIRWVPRDMWNGVEEMAEAYAQEKGKNHVKVEIVPKGANCTAALPGALTLALDILRNEEEGGLTFDHVFIDSGSGMTACALLLAFAFLKKKSFLHIVQVAGTEEEFHALLHERKKELEALVGQKVPSPASFKLYRSSTAPSFGSVNAAIFKTIGEMARTEGKKDHCRAKTRRKYPVYPLRWRARTDRLSRRNGKSGLQKPLYSLNWTSY